MSAESPLGPPLTAEEIRVLGCLVEKSITTPDYYPMTVNALVNACNQRSSRFPIVDYDESAVQWALDGLREKGWAVLVHTAGARTIKYRHQIRRVFEFTDREVALLCTLMLRGPQTAGELRARTARLAVFADLGEVEAALAELAAGYPVPLVAEIPRQAGHKDCRYRQRLGETADAEEPPAADPQPAPPRPAPTAVTQDPGGGERDPVRVLDHPLVKHHLTRLRDRTTPPEAFRNIVNRLSGLLAYEATRDLPVAPAAVTTPMAEAAGARLRGRIGIVPILRAGLGMVDPVLHMIPSAELWHLGFYRDEATLQPVVYYQKLPEAEPVDVGIIVDPMLATGGSAVAAIQALSDWGVPDIKVLAIIAAPEGIRFVLEKTPQVRIFVCAIDRCLNDKGYILPGLGDAGDRICNTRA